MNFHQQFFDLIRQNPDDDAPRLIYADWLDDRGDPRGEFIRVQCELAKIPSREVAKRHPLESREQLLLKHFQAEWTQSLAKFSARNLQFHRGFLKSAELFFKRPRHADSCQLSEQWKQVIAQEPGVSEMGLLVSWAWNEIAHLEHAPQLKSLRIANQGLSRREVSVLMRWPVMRGLAKLNLSHNNLRSGVECVVRTPSLQSLTHLDLSFNAIGNRGAKALVSSHFLNGIEKLNLRGNSFGVEGKRNLRAVFGSKVQL